MITNFYYSKFQKEKILKNGYPFERHSVTTEDGYILSIFRIRGGRNSTKTSSKPVLVHPGILTAPDSFIALGPKQGLGFILADKGYDVWMLSPRGTTYSKRHKYIDVKTNQKAFFNFRYLVICCYSYFQIFFQLAWNWCVRQSRHSWLHFKTDFQEKVVLHMPFSGLCHVCSNDFCKAWI